MSIGIGLCVNQTRAVLEALFGRETEFVRTPKHGIRGRLEAWSSKKYRAAKSLTPFIELGMAALLRGRDGGRARRTATTCRCRSWRCSCAASATSAGCRCGRAASASRSAPSRMRALSPRAARAVPIVPPPAFPLLGSKLTDLNMETVGGDASVNDSAARHIARA